MTSPAHMSHVGQFHEEGTPRPLGSTFAGPYNEFALPSLYEDVLNGSDFEYAHPPRRTPSARRTRSSTPFPVPGKTTPRFLPLDPTAGGDAVSSKARGLPLVREEGGNNVPANESIPYPIWELQERRVLVHDEELSHDDLRS